MKDNQTENRVKLPDASVKEEKMLIKTLLFLIALCLTAVAVPFTHMTCNQADDEAQPVWIRMPSGRWEER